MILRTDWNIRQQQWAEYHRWAQAELPQDSVPEESIADIGAILEWIPESVHAEQRDPERLGVRRMHYLLGRLSGA